MVIIKTIIAVLLFMLFIGSAVVTQKGRTIAGIALYILGLAYAGNVLINSIWG